MINPIVPLIRTESGLEGTFGKLLAPDYTFSTAELPWKNNQTSISCIPFGEYECSIVDSPKYGLVYQVHNVPNRTHILFHWGNWAGDKSSGYKSNSDGCIILGMTRAIISGQNAVSSSRVAVERFHKIMGNKPFTLIVSGFDIW